MGKGSRVVRKREGSVGKKRKEAEVSETQPGKNRHRVMQVR
jgi:hypothetical protein